VTAATVLLTTPVSYFVGISQSFNWRQAWNV